LVPLLIDVRCYNKHLIATNIMHFSQNNPTPSSIEGYPYQQPINETAWSFKEKLPEDGQHIVLNDTQLGTKEFIRFNAEFDFSSEELEKYTWHPASA
jgi:hypothetical protein